MVCKICDKKEVISGFCEIHFLDYFESSVLRAIDDFDLLKKSDRVCVAVSGGKDSVVLLYLLHKFGFDVSGLAIDEGIDGYRSFTLEFLKKFCDNLHVPLIVKSFRDEFGKDLDVLVKSGSACNICGTFRRFLLNKYSQGFDKVATGHNLDDEAQAVLMNLFKAQVDLFDRQGPITKKVDGFTQKIKPLYYLKEKEVLAYSFIKGFDVPVVECPYTSASFRSKVRDFLNSLEFEHSGCKERIISKFLSLKKNDSESLILSKCEVCGFPCDGDVCKACRLKKSICDF